MRSSAGHAGFIVVAADGEPSAEDRFVLQALAQQTGVVLVNARLQADERATALRALQRHAAELERSNAELEQFARITSHDLSEPLRVIAGFAQLLQRRYQGRLDGDADQLIGFIVEGVHRMHTLIAGVLAYSHAGQARLAPGPVDLGAVVRQAVEALDPMVTATRAKVEAGELPRVHADPAQLQELLQNLLANALTFHGRQPPRIRLTASREPDAWRVSVADNGIGIDAAHRDTIFRIFQRLHGRDDYPGTGVGLAVCQRIVQRHGGRIWVEPGPEGGSVFHFTLPDP
jgi:light-regulated signal transduction histidine kinase (bacteriophytochrome)